MIKNTTLNQLCQTKIKLVLIGLDCLAMLLSLVLSFLFVRILSALWGIENAFYLDDLLTLKFLGLYTLFFLGGLGYFSQKEHYRLKSPWWQQVRHILFFCTFSLVITSFFSFMINMSIGRLWVIMTWLMAFVCLLLFRWVARGILIRTGCWSIPTILIGGVGNLIEACYALRSENYLHYQIQYVVLVNESGEGHEALFHASHPGIEIREEHDAFSPHDYVVICPDDRNQMSLRKTTLEVQKAGAHFAIIPPLEGVSLFDFHASKFFGYGITLLEPSVILGGPFMRFFKLLMDKIGALVALILFSPLMVFLCWKVCQDGGPAFYGQMRVGKDGRLFKCWKFRSMAANADALLKELLENDQAAREEYERDFKLKKDPRITKIGEILRKTSLDELPQLFNVLRGDMSLVGPRPIVEDEKKYYKERLMHYMSVKPGMSGLWQVSGRSDLTYAQRVYLDSWYVEHWSIWSDLVIIIKTVFVLLQRRGAY